MNTYQSNIDLAEAAQLLRGAVDIVVTAHAKPDADAFGAVLALTTALRARGASAHAWLMPPVPANLMGLKGSEIVQLYESPGSLGQPDLVAVLDTGAWSQLTPMRDELTQRLARMLIIDHHLSGDVPAAWRYIDGKAAACCEQIGHLLNELNKGADPCDDAVVRDALYVGLAADTGWFRFSNTTSITHDMAARLLRRGVDHAALYRQLQETERPEKLALLTRALSSLELIAGNRVAVMVLAGQDFANTAARIEETEHIVDLPQMVADVQVVVLITEPPNRGSATVSSQIRVSFRSKPGPGEINVARIAQDFGGGGHARAAGARMSGPLNDVVSRVRTTLTEAVSAARSGR